MSPDSLNSALQTVSDLLNSGQSQAAADALENLLEADPENDALLHPRMLLHAQAGQFEDAFSVACRLSAAFKQDWRVSIQILNIARNLRQINPDGLTEQEICRLLEFPGINCEPLSEIVFLLFRTHAQQCQDATDPCVAADKSKIINTALRHFWLTSVEIEPVVTQWRAELLRRCASGTESLADTTRLATSIALQSHRNEYAFFVDRTESLQLENLAATAENSEAAEESSAESVLTLLMYQSPTEVRNRIGMEKLCHPALDSNVLDFIAQDVDETETLRRYASQFSANMITASDVSHTVAQMYQENPYPRWVDPEANTNPEKLSYPDFYGLTASPAWHSATRLDYTTMLVAGCGTGWHPISHAITFPWARIMAIDLSPQSLAYARLMAEKLGIVNVTFAQADILQLDDALGLFDVVESVGTLHHLENPDEGLRRLLQHLKPGGVLRLGCYSRLARRAIVQLRNELATSEQPIDRDYIRNLRHRLLNDDELAPVRDVMRFSDFFSISGCRDLILHPQETQYTIPDLQRMLAENSLEFLTFSPAQMMRFEMLKGRGSPYDLGAWDAVEQAEPHLFTTMYQFFTQYRG